MALGQIKWQLKWVVMQLICELKIHDLYFRHQCVNEIVGFPQK